MLPLAESLCGKWTRATDGGSETKPAFEQLTDCLDASLVQEWTEQERVAMEQHGDHLKIYQVASVNRGELPLLLLGYRSLIQVSTTASCSTPEVVENRCATRKPSRFDLCSNRKSTRLKECRSRWSPYH